MNFKKFLLALTLGCISCSVTFAQEWVRKMQDPTVNFYDTQQEFYTYWAKKEKKEQRHKNSIFYKLFKEEDKAEFNEQEKPGWEPFKRWEHYMAPRVYPSGNKAEASRAWTEYQAWLQQQQQMQPMANPGNGGNNSTSSNTGNAISASAIGNWTFMGPDSVPTNGGGAGRVNFVRFDPTNSNKIWVSAPAGGLWKSIDGGNTWTTNTDQLSSIGVSDVVIDSTNTNTMYLASGDGDAADTYSIGVLKSTDGGATWNATGLTWTIPTNTNTIRKLLINPNNTQIVYAASSAGIYRTANGGTNWTMVQAGDFKDIEFKPRNPNVIYASTSNSTFFRSTNGGTSFTQITSGLSTGAGRFAIGVTNADTNYVYVLAANNTDQGFFGLYQSTNGGTSFTSMSTTPNVLGWNDNGGDTGGQGWYDLSIAVSPVNKNIVLVGGVNIWKSTNGGASWTIHAHWTTSPGAPYVHADIHALEFLPGSGTTYFAGCDGGLFRTTDSGVTWTDKSHGLKIAQIYRLGVSTTNANLNLTGHQDNGTNRWNGTSWSQVLGGDGMECIVDFTNASIMYGEVYYGDIYKSTNGGANFSNIATTGGTGVDANGDWVTPYIMCPQKNTTLLVGKDQVFRSRDAGGSWTQVGTVSGGTGSIIALAYGPTDSTHIYAAKSDKFYASTNGTSFTDRTAGLPVASASITYIAVSNIDANKIWVTFSGYSAANKVWYSADAGATWTNYSTGLPNLPVNCVVRQNGNNDALYIGTDVGVYYRDNTLSAWTSFSTGLPNVIVKELEIQYSSNKLRAATFGRGLWQSDLYCLAPSIGGTATASPGSVCSGGTSTITLTGSSGSRQWQSSTDNTNFTDISGATNLTYATTALTSTTYFRCAVTNGACSTSYSISDTVKVAPSAGTVTATPGTICTGGTSTLTAAGYTGSVQWQSSTNNTTFANITGATSPTYNTPALTATTYYRTVHASGACPSVNAIADTVVVNPVSVGGTATASPSTICAGGTSTITLTGSNGAVQWQSSTNNTTFTNIAGATSASYVTPALSSLTYYRAAVTSNGCASANSSSDTVQVNTAPVAATGPSMTICKGMNITIGSTPVSGNSYAWSPSTGLSASNIANPIASPPATTTYTLTETSPNSGCAGNNTVTITVINCGGSTGLNEGVVEEGLSVFPNPAKEVLNVRFANNETGNYSVCIFNVEGKMVKQETWMKDSAILEKKLLLNGLSNGVYQMKIMGNDKAKVISFEIH